MCTYVRVCPCKCTCVCVSKLRSNSILFGRRDQKIMRGEDELRRSKEEKIRKGEYLTVTLNLTVSIGTL